MLSELLRGYKARVEQQLAATLEQRAALSPEPRLQEAMQYSLLNGGKRLRPALVYLANQLCNGRIEAADCAASAIEMIHSYSLVHDDLPAMDDDNLRRGRPTCHIQYDEPTAILVGDALLTLAFEQLSQPNDILEPEQQLSMLRCLARASGDLGMVIGQSIDLNSAGKTLSLEQLRAMHSAKTGALINAALELGARSAKADQAEIEQLLNYGNAIGLAFQIKDDLLDIESDTETLGKPQGSDQARDKATYPALIGLEESRRWLVELRDSAIRSLNDFSTDTTALTELAYYITDRKH